MLAVVVQANQYRFGRTVLLVPFTSNLAHARDPFGVAVAATQGNGLTMDSVAMCWQVMAVDGNRLVGPPLGRVSTAVLDLVAKNVAVLIEFEPGYLSRTGPSAPHPEAR